MKEPPFNPFESPTSESRAPAPRSHALLKIFALVCWLAAAFWTLGGMLVMGMADVASDFATTPVFAVFLWLFVFGLPVLGAVLLGFAAWRRSFWLSIASLVMLLPFAAMLTIGMLAG